MAIADAFAAGSRAFRPNTQVQDSLDALLGVLRQRETEVNQQLMQKREIEATAARQEQSQSFQAWQQEKQQSFQASESKKEHDRGVSKQQMQNLFTDYERRQAQSFAKELEQEKSPVERAKKVEEYLNQADMQGNPATEEVKKQRMQILGIKETGMVSVKNLMDTGAISKESGESLLSRGVKDISEKEAAIHQKAALGKAMADSRAAALRAMVEYHKAIGGGKEIQDLSSLVSAADKLRDNIAKAESQKSGIESLAEGLGFNTDELKSDKELLAEIDSIIKQKTSQIKGGKTGGGAPSGNALKDAARNLPGAK